MNIFLEFLNLINDKKTPNKNCFLLNDNIIRVILDNSYSKAHIFIYIFLYKRIKKKNKK